jgi:hypothetical protein
LANGSQLHDSEKEGGKNKEKKIQKTGLNPNPSIESI